MSQLINDNHQSITILDGGMGHELRRIGAPFRQPEWSALALMEDPNTVHMAHNNFIKAGADVITINAYALVPFHVGDADTYNLGQIASDQALKSKTKSSRPIAIAGCIPPAFGSYRPDLFDFDKYNAIIAPLIHAQQDVADFWIVETITSISEAIAACHLLKNTEKPVWLSFNLDDDDGRILRSGEAVTKALEQIKQYDIDAILFNCNPPEIINDALQIVANKMPDIKTGAYANNFTYNKERKANETISDFRDDVPPSRYLEFAKQWRESGASIIGGCCGIRPDHIKALSDHFTNTTK